MGCAPNTNATPADHSWRACLMRVVHISKVTGIAGSEGHLLRLLPGLAAQGVDTQMIVLEDPRRPVDAFFVALADQGITAYRLPIQHHLDFNLPARLQNLLRTLKPDIVHTHLLHADLYGISAARRTGARAVISSRHNDDKFRGNLLLKILNQRVMRHANCVIAISRGLATFVECVEGLPPEKIVTIHYGLEAPARGSYSTERVNARTELGYGPSDQVVGIFGRLIEQKGVDVLLDAFVQVRAQHPNARLLIVGDGRDRAGLEAQTETLGLQDATQFMGWIDHAQRLMPACDIITVPSRWEGFGLVTLEAMGWARPLIASRTSALPEIVIDGETGLLVPPENSQALAKAINQLLDEPETASQMGCAGFERLVEHFSVEKMVCATLDLYRLPLE
jgi:glycosyltransferase involved in cell wall biosynthesis